MTSAIESSKGNRFEQNADDEHGGHHENGTQNKRVGCERQRPADECPDHEQGSVRQVHQVHDPEHQRESGGH